jgi:excinuclease ABC subunit A
MVPDDSLTIRERAIAAWPTAWQGQNLRDISTTLGYDVDIPWRSLPKKHRQWFLFTDDQPQVPVYAGYTPAKVRRALRNKEEPSYQGTFTSAKRHVMQTFATTESASMKRRVAQFMISSDCPLCTGKRLRRESLSVTVDGRDIADIVRVPLGRLDAILRPWCEESFEGFTKRQAMHPEKAIVTQRITQDIVARLGVMLDLGLGYLALERSTPTLSPGELQRLRLATQVRSNLFGVVYVLDEPSAGLHPADTEALLRALDRLKASGNSLFVVEHGLDVVRRADWIVDVGPAAGELGGRILYSGPLAGLRAVEVSETRRHLFSRDADDSLRTPCDARRWLRLEGVTRNNLLDLDVSFPLGVLTTVTGVSGSGKSSLVNQMLVELVSNQLGSAIPSDADDAADLEASAPVTLSGSIASGMEGISRLVTVDQKPIGRTPRSNLATYTGLLDHVRKLFAATKPAKARKCDAGRFSFNVAKGRCETCAGEGFVMVELLFLPSVYAPCPTCHGARYNAKTLEITLRGKNIADVLGMTVDAAYEFFADEHRRPSRACRVARRRPRLPPTRPARDGAVRRRGAAHQARHRAAARGARQHAVRPRRADDGSASVRDVERLIVQLEALVDAGNTVIVVEHDMRVVASSDWIMDIGPGAGDEGRRMVACGIPREVAKDSGSKTAPYLGRFLQ